MISANAVLYSLLGGILPAVFWLLFWLREDSKRPEPRGLLILAFFSGMIAVVLTVPISLFFQKFLSLPDLSLALFITLAGIEEILKFGVAYFAVLRRKEDDEPIDPLIYMMTVALGFVALENVLFILKPVLDGHIVESFITGNIRFVGASLLHTISSAIVGIALAFSFYKSRYAKQVYALGGLILAIALHAAFNFFIIMESSSITLATLGFVWIAIVLLMLIFEKVKRIRAVNNI